MNTKHPVSLKFRHSLTSVYAFDSFYLPCRFIILIIKPKGLEKRWILYEKIYGVDIRPQANDIIYFSFGSGSPHGLLVSGRRFY